MEELEDDKSQQTVKRSNFLAWKSSWVLSFYPSHAHNTNEKIPWDTLTYSPKKYSNTKMELENDAWQEGTSWVSGDFRNPPEEQVARGFSLIFRQTRTPLKRKNQSTREVLVALLPFTFHLNFRAGVMLMSCNVALRALEPSLGWVYGWQKFQWQLSKQTRQKKTQSNITFSEDVFSIKNEDMSIAMLVFQRLCDGFNYFFCFAPNLAFDLRHFFYMGGD